MMFHCFICHISPPLNLKDTECTFPSPLAHTKIELATGKPFFPGNSVWIAERIREGKKENGWPLLKDGFLPQSISAFLFTFLVLFMIKWSLTLKFLFNLTENHLFWCAATRRWRLPGNWTLPWLSKCESSLEPGKP